MGTQNGGFVDFVECIIFGLLANLRYLETSVNSSVMICEMLTSLTLRLDLVVCDAM